MRTIMYRGFNLLFLVGLLWAVCGVVAVTQVQAVGFTPAGGSLNTGRNYATTTLLQNGKVLIAGGLVTGAAQQPPPKSMIRPHVFSPLPAT